MKVIWRKVKNLHYQRKYEVSNYGDVRIIESKRLLTKFKFSNGALYVGLNKNGHTTSIAIHRLVFKHFKIEELSKKKWVHHLDFNKENNHSPNLDQKSRGDYLRLWNTERNRQRGVYFYKQPKKNGKGFYEKYRAVVKYRDKVKTLGYFKTKQEAEIAYYGGFKELYGYYPYTQQ